MAEGIERLVEQAGGSVAKEVEALSAAYRGERPSRAARTPAQVAAYLAYRAPATFAAAAAAFRQVALPDAFLDAGALPTLHDRYGISASAMATSIKGWL